MVEMKCVRGLCYSRCFFGWYIYHGIGLMSHQANCISMTWSVSNGCGEMCACLGMCTNAMCKSPNVFSRCFSP